MTFKEIMLKKYEEMLSIKESLGYSRHTYSSYVVPFIDYCATNFDTPTTITREMLDGWLMTEPFQTENTHRLAIINIRHFAKHLNSIGTPAFIPPSSYNIKYQPYQPYIFTDNELVELFNTIDSVKLHGSCKANVQRILPVLFRLELCCGLRPGEPFRLKKEDVNVTTGDIFIRKSKRGKDRHIIMSEEMRRLCEVYDSLEGEREWFFQYETGKPIPTGWGEHKFTAALKRCNFSYKGNKPRPYDLRHNFATRTIMRWVDEGRDIMALMPYLSEYMGHVSLEETFYYIHLIPDRLKKSPNINWDMMSNIYARGKENQHEEN